MKQSEKFLTPLRDVVMGLAALGALFFFLFFKPVSWFIELLFAGMGVFVPSSEFFNQRQHSALPLPEKIEPYVFPPQPEGKNIISFEKEKKKRR